jgi:hypothetical protein
MRSLLKNLIIVFCKKITKLKPKLMKLVKANMKILKGINYIQYSEIMVLTQFKNIMIFLNQNNSQIKPKKTV